ncbi:group I intron-associated PD-(D/E)XK endonuclease [Actinoallomurus vinaceus]
MPNHRTYTDQQLRDAVASAACWGDVLESVGKTRKADNTWVRRRAEQLGLDTSHFAARRGSMIPAVRGDMPFKGGPPHRVQGRLGTSAAIQWFLERGYMVSMPIEPTAYDLVVESDDGLQRVQVKTTEYQKNGIYYATITWTQYVADAQSNAHGRYRHAPYADGTIDYFFIVAGDGKRYLIPQSVVRGLKQIGLTRKYRAFEV